MTNDAPLLLEPDLMPDTAAMERGIKAACHVHFRHIPDAECRWPDCGHHRDQCVELAAIVSAALTAMITPSLHTPEDAADGYDDRAIRGYGSGDPAPKAEASDLERARQVVLDLTGRDPGEESAWGRVVATALAAVRREAASAEREWCVETLRKYATQNPGFPASYAIDRLGANKPQD